MSRRFEGKVALVTGGSSGIGRATALAFAREGAKVVVADVDVIGGEETVRLIREENSFAPTKIRTATPALAEVGVKLKSTVTTFATKGNGDKTRTYGWDTDVARFVMTDVSKAAEVQTLIHKVIETFGRLDYAFNNAGIEGITGTTVDLTERNWDRVISTNLTGVWLCMKYEIPEILKQGGGAIVNTSSVAGLVGFQSIPAYVASKHGVVGVTKSAALEYARLGIRINAILPGVVRTPMVERFLHSDHEVEACLLAQEPIGRFGTPEEIAEAVIWLCSDAASFVTGHALVADGGFVAQ